MQQQRYKSIFRQLKNLNAQVTEPLLTCFLEISLVVSFVQHMMFPWRNIRLFRWKKKKAKIIIFFNFFFPIKKSCTENLCSTSAQHIVTAISLIKLNISCWEHDTDLLVLDLTTVTGDRQIAARN